MTFIDNDLSYVVCPLCRSNSIFCQGQIKFDIPTYYSTTQLKLKKTSELWECKKCGSSFVQNAVSEVDAIKLYSEGSSKDRWTILTFEKSKTKSTITKLESFLEPGLKILDIGCGSGNFLDFAKERGCRTYGIEYSKSSREQIKNQGHLSFESVFDVDETFDIITAFDVIEHIYDVPLFLSTCKSKLSPEGYLILLTGNISCLSSKIAKANWWYVRYPEHIVFPSKFYFMKYSGFKVDNWLKTYHSPEAQTNFLKCTLKTCFNFIKNRHYDGFPSLVADHNLIILKNVCDVQLNMVQQKTQHHQEVRNLVDQKYLKKGENKLD